METPSSIQAPVWSEQIEIRSYDVDSTRRATSLSLFRYFLEAAWAHAESLGFGFNHLATQGKFWALSRLRMEAVRYPLWASKVTLRTWPRGIQSVFAMRDFEFLDDAGARLAAGACAWLVVDSATRRPQRLHKILPALAALEAKSAIEQDPGKLEDNETWDSQAPLAVRYTDIDVNNHANSARYIGWILDSYPAGFHLAHTLRSLELNYLNETREGDHLVLHTRAHESGQFSHALKKQDAPDLFRARLQWSEFVS